MFQTIPEFLSAPFGEPEIKSNELERKYKSLVQKKKISIHSYCKIDDDHLIHIQVGSDTNENEYYDVVLLFFTDDEMIKKTKELRKYYVKFFSNSPSFIYQYAALYKKNGFLIDLFYEKMDQEFADKLPEKVNKLSYDKSIYSACRFMEDHKASAYSILVNNLHSLSPEKFMRGIKDFNDIKSAADLRSIDKKINKELEKNKGKKKNERNSRDSRKKRSTFQDSNGIKKTTVVRPTSRTSGTVRPSKVVQKKKATRRTKSS